jgi:3',5'-cyclic AMP phosphodiesterase CpdA
MSNFSFIQLADTQFGLFASSSGKTDEEIAEFAERGLILRKTEKFEGFAPETALFTRAIEQANRLKPSFVVVCGDMVNEADSDEQIAEVKRIGELLDHTIDLHWVPGNHDVAYDHNTPDQESLDRYRKNFGPDYYAFSHQDVRFIVINSTVLSSPKTMPDEEKAQLAFIEAEASIAGHQNTKQTIIFSHHPLFVESADEADNPWSIKKKYREPILEIAADHGITANFAGHWHRNNIVSENGIEVVASGSVGYPLGDDPSGFRTVEIKGSNISHKYHSLESD